MPHHRPSQLDDWTFRRVVWATLVLGSVALTFWLLYRFNQAVFILFIAILMGTVIRPAVAWLHRRGLPRIAGGILVYLLLFALLIGFVLLLFPLIAEQGTTIAAAVPGYYSSLHEWMASYPNQLIVRLSEFLPATLPAARRWLRPGGHIVSLVKPQFEAGREQVGKGGVVRDPAVHQAVLLDLLAWGEAQGLGPQGLARSPGTGLRLVARLGVPDRDPVLGAVDEVQPVGGEAIVENEDSLMPLETPEVVSDGLQVMNEQLGVPLSAVARQMGVQPRLLDDLLGKATESSDTIVVNLFR